MAQIIFVLIAIVLTIMLVILGVQVFFILKEIRSSLSKANRLLDDAGNVTESLKESLERVTTIGSGIKVGSILLSLFSNMRKKKKDEES